MAVTIETFTTLGADKSGIQFSVVSALATTDLNWAVGDWVVFVTAADAAAVVNGYLYQCGLAGADLSLTSYTVTNTGSVVLQVWYGCVLSVPYGPQAGAVAQFSAGAAASIGWRVRGIAGLALSNSSTGTGTDIPISTATNAAIGNVVLAAIGLEGPIDDTAGTWESDSSNDANTYPLRSGTTGSGAASNITVVGAIDVVDISTAPAHAHYTASAGRDYAAAILTFDVPPSRDITTTASLLSVGVTLDKTSSTSTIISGTTSTVSHTTGNYDDRYMLVGIIIMADVLSIATAHVDSVTYNSVNLTYVNAYANAKERVEIWQMIAPPVGTYDVTMVLNETVEARSLAVTTWYRVRQTTPIGTIKSDSTTSSGLKTHDVVTTTGDVVLDIFAAPQMVTNTAGQNIAWYWHDDMTSPYLTSTGAYKSGTSTATTMSQTTAYSATTLQVGVPIRLSALLRDIPATVSLSSNLATIGFDRATYGKASATNTKTISHITADQSNRLMLVAVQIYNEPPGTLQVSTVTYNSQSLSYVGYSADTKNRIEYWKMVAPSVGTYNVVATLNGSSSGIGVGASTWYNVHQGTPLGTTKSDSANNSTPTHNVVSVGGDVVMDVIGTVTSITGFDGSQTQLWNDVSATPPYIDSAASYKVATSTSTTMSGTLQSIQTWIQAGIAIHPSSTYLGRDVISIISLSHRFARPIEDISNDGGWPGTPLWSKMDEV